MLERININYIREMRIKHYLKNLFIFCPLFFSGQLFDNKQFFATLFGFISFSLMCSCIYIINDIRDMEKDKLHEIKKHRPLASGKIKVRNAIYLTIVLTLISLSITCYISYIQNSIAIILILLTYYGINLFYSFFGKNIALLDIVLLSMGFLLRVLYGGAITGIPISSWLYLVVITGAFYLGFGKRRNELVKNNDMTRSVLAFYSKEFLDKNMYCCMTLSIVFFSLWCLERNAASKESNFLLLVPILLVICIRYSMDIETTTSSGDPINVILKDKILIGLVVCFGILMFYFIY